MVCTTQDIFPGTARSLVERLVDFKIGDALLELGYLGSISALDQATIEAEAQALQCTTAGPYNVLPPVSFMLAQHAAFVSTSSGSIISALLLGTGRRPTHSHSSTLWKKLMQLVSTTVLPFMLLLPTGQTNS